MQDILDFNKEFNVSQFDYVVNAMFTVGPEVS